MPVKGWKSVRLTKGIIVTDNNTGDTVFDNVDELLTDKIVSHTHLHTKHGKKKPRIQDSESDTSHWSLPHESEFQHKKSPLAALVMVFCVVFTVVFFKALLSRRK